MSSAGQAAIDFSDPMLEKNYDGVRAYCQSKLAQILFITVNALHPATYMETKIVPSPISGIEEGVRATVRLIESVEVKDVTGKYFDGMREARPNAQAHDEGARAKLHKVSDEIIVSAKTLKNLA